MTRRHGPGYPDDKGPVDFDDGEPEDTVSPDV